MGHRFVYNPYPDYITPSKSRQVQSSLSTPGYCPLRSQQRAKIPSPFHGFTSGKKSIILKLTYFYNRLKEGKIYVSFMGKNLEG